MDRFSEPFLYPRGRVDLFFDGSVTFETAPLVRPTLIHPTIPDYHGTDPDVYDPQAPVRVPGEFPSQFPTPGNPGPLPPAHRARIFNLWAGRVELRPLVPGAILFSAPTGLLQFHGGSLYFGSDGYGPGGAVTDFAFWPHPTFVGIGYDENDRDPANALSVEVVTALATSDVATPWTRHYAIFTPPKDTTYLGVGGKFLAMPGTSSGNNRHQHVKKVQVEVLPTNETTPSDFVHPREVVVEVRPDRMNWSTNPSFKNNTTNWTGVTRIAHPTLAGVYSGKVSVALDDTETVEHTIPLLREGKTFLVTTHVYILFGHVLVTPDCDAPFVTVKEYPPGTEGRPALPIRIQVPADHETPIHVRVTPDSTGSVTMTYDVTATGYTGDTEVYFYHTIVEETEEFRGYFDGDTPGDYLWETGQTSGNARSYYYKNYLERYATINRLLAQNVPLGIGVGGLKYGYLPPEHPPGERESLTPGPHY